MLLAMMYGLPKPSISKMPCSNTIAASIHVSDFHGNYLLYLQTSVSFVCSFMHKAI